MKTIKQCIDDADRKSSRKLKRQLAELLNNQLQQCHSNGSHKMQTLRMKKWN